VSWRTWRSAPESKSGSLLASTSARVEVRARRFSSREEPS
jgi:hypothetical protein